MYSNNPKAGGWIEPAPAATNTGSNSISAAGGGKIQKSQLNKTMVKPNTSNATSTTNGARG